MKSKTLLLIIFLIATIGVAHSQVVDPGLVKTYMKFDGNLDDSSNNPVTYNLLEGSVTFAEGKFGQAGSFDAAAILSSGLGFNPVNSFTMATWMLLFEVPSVTGDANTWIAQLDGGQDPGRLHLAINQQDQINNFTNGEAMNDSIDPVVANTWYHVAIVKNTAENTHTLYVNGVKKNQLEAGTESTDTEIHLGARKNLAARHRARGLMDELLITGQVLSEEDINYIMNNSIESAMQPSSVNDLAAMSFRAYHSNGSLHAMFNSDMTNADYAVYAITGQRVLHGVISGTQLTVGAPLVKGVYVLQVNSGNVPYNSKFIVN
jgi:hypothetical protein